MDEKQPLADLTADPRVGPSFAPFADPVDRRAHWLAKRRSLITATDAAKVLGFSPWGAPIDVYLDKIGEAPEFRETAATRRGKRRERLVLEAYADDEGRELAYADPFAVLTNPTFAHLGATLDAQRVDDGRSVEAKTCRWPGAEWGPHDTDVMPTYYATQLYVQMIVTGTDVADLPVEFYGEEYRRYRLHRDPVTSEKIVEMLGTFWAEHVARRVAPPIDGSAGYASYLQRMFAKHTEAVVKSSAEIDRVATSLAFVRGQIDKLETQKAEAENVIKGVIGAAEAKKILGPNWSATWTKSKDGVKIDWEAVAYDLAEQHAAVMVERGGNPLIVTPAKFVTEAIPAHSTPRPGVRSFRFTSEESV